MWSREGKGGGDGSGLALRGGATSSELCQRKSPPSLTRPPSTRNHPHSWPRYKECSPSRPFHSTMRVLVIWYSEVLELTQGQRNKGGEWL